MSTRGGQPSSGGRARDSLSASASPKPYKLPKLPTDMGRADVEIISRLNGEIKRTEEMLARARTEPDFHQHYPAFSEQHEQQRLREAKAAIRQTINAYRPVKGEQPSLTPSRELLERNLGLFEKQLNRYAKQYGHDGNAEREYREAIAALRGRMTDSNTSEPTLTPARAGESARDHYTRARQEEVLHDLWLKAAGNLPGERGWRVAQEALRPALDRQSDMNAAIYRLGIKADMEQRAAERTAHVAAGRQLPYLRDIVAGHPVAVRGSNGVSGVIRLEGEPGNHRLALYPLGAQEPQGTRLVSDANVRDDIAAIIGHTEGPTPHYVATLSPDWAPPTKGSALARYAREYAKPETTPERRAQLERFLLGLEAPPAPKSSRSKKAS